ncbi:hypothetical protein [Moritella sp. F3]|uniref:hypothetical protein n=1 Tax=Moritella sp. F3 TaxID=2718882 RepID=UPI0018E0FFBC|nr:hypothetical protein [Moritella sp. F3]GIC77177.1 hypothetical protein FMO001_19040 [Moritella sp. F1]GIC82296.1 hypothetical protein FMO003_25770 [Moritella sp. F3]
MSHERIKGDKAITTIIENRLKKWKNEQSEKGFTVTTELDSEETKQFTAWNSNLEIEAVAGTRTVVDNCEVSYHFYSSNMDFGE